MIEFRFSLTVDLGLGAAASRTPIHAHHHSAATDVGGTANERLGVCRRPGAPVEPLGAGPLEPEREGPHQLGRTIHRWEE